MQEHAGTFAGNCTSYDTRLLKQLYLYWLLTQCSCWDESVPFVMGMTGLHSFTICYSFDQPPDMRHVFFIKKTLISTHKQNTAPS